MKVQKIEARVFKISTETEDKSGQSDKNSAIANYDSIVVL